MNLIRKASWLSLDIVLGTLILLFFIADRLLGLIVPFSVYIGLGLSVWVIYTFDHLRDSKKYRKVTTERHKFHRENYVILYRCMIICIFCAVLNLFFLPVIVVLIGSVLVLLIGLYFLFDRKVIEVGAKEIMVAFGYSGGVFLFPFAMIGFTPTLLVMASQLFLIAFINLLIISDFEFEKDKKHDVDSITRYLDGRQMQILLRWIYIVLVLSSLFSLFVGLSPFQYNIFVILAGSLLFFAFWRNERLKVRENYSVWVDIVFFLPLPLSLL